MTPHDPRDGEPITEILGRLRSRIGQLFLSFQLDASMAEEVLQEVLSLLAYRWERIANREVWLLATLRRTCQRRTVPRQRRVARHSSRHS